MKRQVQSLGVKKWSGNDLLDLQAEGFKVLDTFFSQFSNCAITGVVVVGTSITEGLVSIDGVTLPFAGATDVTTFPVYLKKSESHNEREYADGVVRDISVEYYAELVANEPSTSYLKIESSGTTRFFEKEWFDTINQNITTLRTADTAIAAKLQQLVIPILDSEPTSTTLTYSVDDTSYNFMVGQQCRVQNNESGDYTFYYVADITADAAVWKAVGSGNELALEEEVFITLMSNQGTNDTSLNGIAVSVTWEGQEEALEMVWNGSVLKATIPISVQYTVTTSSIDGYSSPEAQSFLAIGGNKRQVYCSYMCEKVSISVTADNDADTSGRIITVKHATTSATIYSGAGSAVVIKVPMGIPYTVSVNNWATYIPPLSKSFTANQAVRTVLLEYR